MRPHPALIPTPEPPPRRSRRRAGVTLIELTLVVVIIGLVTVIAMPRVDQAAHDADAAQKIVRGTVMRTQRLAVQRQYLVGLAFDTAGGRMRTIEDSDQDGRLTASDRTTSHSLPPNARFVLGASALPGAPTTGSGAIRGTALQSIDDMPTLLFYRHGAASSDAVLYVGARSRHGIQQRAVSVVQTTGRSDSYRLTGTTWRIGGI